MEDVMREKNSIENSVANTVSITRAVKMLGWTIPRLHRNVKNGTLQLVQVEEQRFQRITIESLVKLLKKELSAITVRSNSIKNSLTVLQTMLDKEYAKKEMQSSPKYDAETFSYLSDPRNAELRCEQRREA
jgi:hypothetical protein